jgi:hypothetical protein
MQPKVTDLIACCVSIKIPGKSILLFNTRNCSSILICRTRVPSIFLNSGILTELLKTCHSAHLSFISVAQISITGLLFFDPVLQISNFCYYCYSILFLSWTCCWSTNSVYYKFIGFNDKVSITAVCIIINNKNNNVSHKMAWCVSDHPHTKQVWVLNHSGSLITCSVIIAVRPEAKENIRLTFMVIDYVLQKNDTLIVAYFLKIRYHRSFKNRKLNYASVTSTSQVCLPAMLLLLIVENYKVWHWGGLWWQKFITSFVNIGQILQTLK